MSLGGSSPAISSLEHFPNCLLQWQPIILELALRLEKVITQMHQPNWPIMRGGSGVRVQVLPEIPRFEFDLTWTRRVKSDRISFEVDAREKDLPASSSLAKRSLLPFVPLLDLSRGRILE